MMTIEGSSMSSSMPNNSMFSVLSPPPSTELEYSSGDIHTRSFWLVPPAILKCRENSL